jgi:hypothetical protein
MSAAQRSVARRLLSAFLFAAAIALLILAWAHRAEAQVLIQDPCKGFEPGSASWYFFLCWLGDAAAFVRAIFSGGRVPMLVQ